MSNNGQIWKGGTMQFTSVEEAANVVHLAEQAFLNTIHEKRRIAYDGWQAAQEMMKMDRDPVARTALRVNLQTTVVPTGRARTLDELNAQRILQQNLQEAQGYQTLRRDLLVRVKAGWNASCDMIKLQGHPKLLQADQAGLQRDAELYRLFEDLKKTQEQNVQPAAPPAAPPTPVDTLVSPATQGGPQTPTTHRPQHVLSQPTAAQGHHTQSHTIHNPAPTLHYDTFSLNAALPTNPSFTRVDSLFDPEVTLPIIDKMRRDPSMHAEAYNGHSFTKCPNGEILVRDHYHSREYTVVAPLRATQASSSRTSSSTPANQAGPSGLNRVIPSTIPSPVAPSIQQSASYRPYVPPEQASRTPPAQPSFTSLSTSTRPPPTGHLPSKQSMAQAGPSNSDRAYNPARQQEFGKGQPRSQSVNSQPPRPLSQPAAMSTQPQQVPPVQVTVSPAQNVSALSRDDIEQSISAPPPSSKHAMPRPSSLSVAPRKGTLAQDLLRALLPKRARSDDDAKGPVAKVQIVGRNGRPEALPAPKVNSSNPTEVESRLANTGQVADKAEPRPAPAVNSAGVSTPNLLSPTIPPGYRPFNQTTMHPDPSVQAAVAVNLRPPPALSPLTTAQSVQVTKPSLPANAVAGSSRVTTDTFTSEQPGHPNNSNLSSRSVSVQEAPLFLPSSPGSSTVSVEKVPSESSDSEDEQSSEGKEVNAVGHASREFAGRVLKQVFVEMPRPPDWVHTHLQRMREEAEVEKSLFVSMNMTNGDEGEEDALREAMTRLRRSPCCWTDCDSVLNCPERLRRHLLLHDGTRQQGSQGWKCRWKDCSQKFKGSLDEFNLHLARHALFPIFCPFEGCKKKSQHAREYFEHLCASHWRNGSGLKASSDPTEPVPLEIKDLPSVMPVYKRPVRGHEITAARHTQLREEVYESIFGKSNDAGADAPILKSAPTLEETHARHRYEYLSEGLGEWEVSEGVNPGRLAELESHLAPKLIRDGELVLWPPEGTEGVRVENGMPYWVRPGFTLDEEEVQNADGEGALVEAPRGAEARHSEPHIEVIDVDALDD